jgi:hypothetical protein
VFFYMQNTAAGGTDDVIEFSEIFYKQIVTPCRKMLETRVGHGLAATGLVSGVNYFTTEFFQQLQGSYAYLGIKLVYVTRYK